MKTTYVSTLAMATATRQSVLRMQAELAVKEKEVATGRLADVGLSLGARTGRSVSLRREFAGLQSIIDSNTIVTARLESTQAALATISGNAQNFLGELIDSSGNRSSASIITASAKAHLNGLIGNLNSANNGEYLFAGLNTDVKPVADYFSDPPSAARQAFETAFTTKFGFLPTDAAVATISGADMKDFLDSGFSALFDDAAWSANWSSSSDQAIRSRISTAELVTTGATANEPGIQKLAMVYSMVADMNISALGEDAYGALIEKATTALAQGTQEISAIQVQLGSTQKAVVDADARLSLQKDVLSSQIGALENVDVYEVSTRISNLLTQIETSYALTARIQRLSLLDYL